MARPYLTPESIDAIRDQSPLRRVAKVQDVAYWVLAMADDEAAFATGAIVDVNGVGYLLQCGSRTLGAMGVGETVCVHVETHVREDHIHLYGFESLAERDWFRLLTTVQGVGTRVALAILSVLSADRLSDALISGDGKMLTQAPGVGPKLAARIVAELKDKAVPALESFARTGDGGSVGDPDALDDAVSALVNLGYRRGEAFGAVSAAARALGSDVEVQALIRAGLKELSS